MLTKIQILNDFDTLTCYTVLNEHNAYRVEVTLKHKTLGIEITGFAEYVGDNIATISLTAHDPASVAIDIFQGLVSDLEQIKLYGEHPFFYNKDNEVQSLQWDELQQDWFTIVDGNTIYGQQN